MLNNILIPSLLALCSSSSSCELGLRNHPYFVIFQRPLLPALLSLADPCASGGREAAKASFLPNVNMELNYWCVQVITTKKIVQANLREYGNSRMNAQPNCSKRRVSFAQ